MSFKAIFDLFLQIHDFINLDLPSRGLFKIRASLYQQQGTQKTYATPFEFREVNEMPIANSKKIYHPQLLKPPYFYSKTGMIKNVDQKVILNDKVRFKLEVQSFPRLRSQKVFLQFDLIYQQCYYSLSNEDFQGKIVQSKKFQLDNLEHGILNYCQGEFIGNYASVFSFTVFACLSNFTFGKYKLPEEIQAIGKEEDDGSIKNYFTKPVQEAKIKEIQRSKVKTFDQLLKWIQKHYKNRIPDPLQYFYGTYVKNLRYYFYLAQLKLNSNSAIARKISLKVPKSFLQLPSNTQNIETEVGQKQFRKYMIDYSPKQLTAMSIMLQVNNIHYDIYMFLLEVVEKQFQFSQLADVKMKNDYQTYIKQLYGERVFRSVAKNNDDIAASSRQNKKIAKKMREKKKVPKTISYPIEDVSFIQNKEMLEFLFYEITNPTKQVANKIINQSIQYVKSEAEIMKITEPQTPKSESTKMLKEDVEQKINKESMLQKQLQEKQKIEIKEIEAEIKSQLMSQAENKKQENKENKQQMSQQNNKQQVQLINYDVKKFEQGNEEVLKLTEDNKENEQEQNDQDVYKNVSHQKGEVDSQLSERSAQNYNIHQQPHQVSTVFSDISEISHKARKKQSQAKPFISNSNTQDQQLPKLKYDEKNMLIVMCHGFQGSSYDMIVLLRKLKQLFPEASYLLSRENQTSTEGNIDQMGQRLAKQVQNYIRINMKKDSVIINFVGHSMGGIIARAGIKYLKEDYFNQFGFFCSLSSPHLGYLNGVGSMIKAGLWAILKFKSIPSLEQLTMGDHKQLKQTFIYKLSKDGSLKRFRKIILLSSFEDSYVTWHSARISAYDSNKKSTSTKLEQQMVTNILGNQPIHRIDVNFNVKTTNLDSFIGRTAHINLIVQESLFKIINATIPDLFNINS